MKPLIRSLLLVGAVALFAGQPAPAATTLNLPVINGTNLVISWNSGGTVELAPTVLGPWVVAAGDVNTASSLIQPLAAGHQFFRVVENGVAGSPQAILPELPDDPFTVERATLRLLRPARADGDGVLAITFAPGQDIPTNGLPLLLDDRVGLFRDDGRFPDALAGDHTYTGIISAETNMLLEMNARIAELAPEQRIQPNFEGRGIIGSNTLEMLNLSNLFAGGMLTVHPLVFGAAESPFDPAAFHPAAVPGSSVAAKSLLITDLSVVQDPARTWDPCNPAAGTPMGAWTFGRLMTDMANTPVSGISAQDFVRRWLRSWQTPQTINLDQVAARDAAIKAQLIDAWEAASGGPGAPLDLSKAPFRLCAIVNRLDLRGNVPYSLGPPRNPCEPPCLTGEGRFVFCAVGPNCQPLQFTVILEYCVPKRRWRELVRYARQWRALASMPFGPAFNAALQAITDQFARANADPSRPNRSAINQVRSNEILDNPWELREWRIFASDSDAGHLREVTVKQTPDFDLDFTASVAAYINANSAAILAEKHVVPLLFAGQPFLGGSSPMPFGAFWDGPPPAGSSIPTPNLRHKFSLNTCSGCHAGETATGFLHVTPRPFNFKSGLSGFLTGIVALDPAGVEPAKMFNDLARREIDLDQLIHTPCFFQIFKPKKTWTH